MTLEEKAERYGKIFGIAVIAPTTFVAGCATTIMLFALMLRVIWWCFMIGWNVIS
jgi:hypothetical protein